MGSNRETGPGMSSWNHVGTGCLLLALSILGCTRHAPPPPAAGATPRLQAARVGSTPQGPVTVLLTAELLGYTEPCGCTVELQEGGIDRLATAVRQARQESSASILLDGGDLLTGEVPIPAGRRDQELLRQELLLSLFGELGYDGLVPGEIEAGLPGGLPALDEVLRRHGLTRVQSNLAASPSGPTRESLLLEGGGLRLGVLGLSDPALLTLPAETDRRSPAWLPLTRELVARQVAGLRGLGATQILVVGHTDRRTARRLLEGQTGIDFWLVAHGSQDTTEVEQVGEAHLLELWTQGRRLGRLELTPGAAPGGPLVPARDPATDGQAAGVQRRIDHLRRGLALLTAPAQEELRQQRASLLTEAEAELAALQRRPPPGTPGSFRWRLVSLGEQVPRDPTVEQRRLAFNRSLVELAHRRTEQAPPPPPGGSRYLGAASCRPCHEQEHAQWLTTPHATALERLAARGKDFDDECVGCHVTGYRQPGGAVLGQLGPLAGVGCESCHGPASRHAETPDEVEMPPAKVDPGVCTACHNQRHSPRFDPATYQPKVLGPGHGQPSSATPVAAD